MVERVLAANPLAVAPAEDACIRDIIWEEIAEPVDLVRSRPPLLGCRSARGRRQCWQCRHCRRRTPIPLTPRLGSRPLPPPGLENMAQRKARPASMGWQPVAHISAPGKRLVESGEYDLFAVTSKRNQLPPSRWCHPSRPHWEKGNRPQSFMWRSSSRLHLGGSKLSKI
jgi:hypothetical protein